MIYVIITVQIGRVEKLSYFKAKLPYFELINTELSQYLPKVDFDKLRYIF